MPGSADVGPRAFGGTLSHQRLKITAHEATERPGSIRTAHVSRLRLLALCPGQSAAGHLHILVPALAGGAAKQLVGLVAVGELQRLGIELEFLLADALGHDA